jgi:hypothetical protein
MSKEELKSVWAEVFAADSKVKEAEAALKAAIRVRSNALQTIVEGSGKGPFSVRGQIMTIRCRSSKTGGEPNYFLVGKGESEITVID